MNKELLKEFIQEEVKVALNEAMFQNLVKKASDALNSLVKDPAELAVFTATMGLLGLHKRDIQYIINIKDPALQKVEFRHLMDRIIRTSAEPKSILSYSYFGKKPQTREKY
jgi:hypothetical protein